MSTGETSSGGMADRELDQILAAANAELLEHIKAAADPTAWIEDKSEIEPSRPRPDDADDRNSFSIACYPGTRIEVTADKNTSVQLPEADAPAAAWLAWAESRYGASSTMVGDAKPDAMVPEDRPDAAREY